MNRRLFLAIPLLGAVPNRAVRDQSMALQRLQEAVEKYERSTRRLIAKISIRHSAKIVRKR